VERSRFAVEVPGGELVGWVEGDGPPVLLLHGGPGLSYEYIDGVATDIGEGFRVATYQQRGVAPSTAGEPFEVAREVADVELVLDALGWHRCWVVGHSWGGHLLLHLLVKIPARLFGGLSVDPLGGVGDGGAAAMEARLTARTPERDRARAAELDQRGMRGEGTAEDALESMRLYWPAYFASPERVMPFAIHELSVAAYAGLWTSLNEALPGLERALPAITLPFGCIVGAESPLSYEQASGPTVRAIPGAWLDVVSDAGHFPWFERPGCVRAGIQRLSARS
jgi:pimeloyl-ACP methyl ester carboxylesterase